MYINETYEYLQIDFLLLIFFIVLTYFIIHI